MISVNFKIIRNTHLRFSQFKIKINQSSYFYILIVVRRMPLNIRDFTYSEKSTVFNFHLYSLQYCRSSRCTRPALLTTVSILLFSIVPTSTNKSQMDQRAALHIGGIFPIAGEGGWQGGQACMPAARLALEDVNARKDLLPGYVLKMYSNDSRVSS